MARPGQIVMAVLAVGILLSSACGQKSDTAAQPASINRGLVSGEPCKPPCWEGLTPGVSTEEEIQQRLQQLQKSGQISAFSCSGGQCLVTRTPDSWSGATFLFLRDRKLASINGNIDSDLEIQQLVTVLGEPAWVSLSELQGRACTCDEGDWTNLGDYTSLLYPEHGTAFTVIVPPEQIGCICPHMKVFAFNYFPPMPSLSEYLQYSATLYNSETPSLSEQGPEDYIPWHGFGSGYRQEP